MDLKKKRIYRDAVPALTDDQRASLKAKIKAEGWMPTEFILTLSDGTIIDGHHREVICRELKITPNTRVATATLRKQLTTDEAVIEWIRSHAKAQRNLTPRQLKVIIGREYNDNKLPQGRPPAGEESNPTAESIAQQSGVGVATVARHGKLAAAFDKLPQGLKTMIEKKPTLATDKAILKLAETKDWQAIARSVRVGDKPTFDAALGMRSNGKAKKKASGKEVSAVKQTDELLKKYVGPIARGIDAIAKINGGKGPWHTQVNDALDKVITGLKKMREGEK